MSNNNKMDVSHQDDHGHGLSRDIRSANNLFSALLLDKSKLEAALHISDGESNKKTTMRKRETNPNYPQGVGSLDRVSSSASAALHRSRTRTSRIPVDRPMLDLRIEELSNDGEM